MLSCCPRRVASKRCEFVQSTTKTTGIFQFHPHRKEFCLAYWSVVVACIRFWFYSRHSYVHLGKFSPKYATTIEFLVNITRTYSTFILYTTTTTSRLIRQYRVWSAKSHTSCRGSAQRNTEERLSQNAPPWKGSDPSTSADEPVCTGFRGRSECDSLLLCCIKREDQLHGDLPRLKTSIAHNKLVCRYCTCRFHSGRKQ